jgi:hypothetical protein
VLGWQRRRRGARATVTLVLALAAAAILPVLLVVHGWHRAELIRGIGPGRGTFTVASCDDPQEGPNDHLIYTCTGTFDGRTAPGVAAKVTSDAEFDAGVSKLAYLAGDGAVSLASDDRAASKVAAWFTVACGVAALEAAVGGVVVRRVRGEAAITRPDRPWSWALLVFGVTLCTWMLAFFVLQVLYRFW